MPQNPLSLLRPAELERDRHLEPGRVKRILSLDGGGVRGLVTLGILKRVETVLAKTHRPEAPEAFRLADYFDLVGGTSTGSIIATLVALGKTVDEIETAYKALAPRIFTRTMRTGIQRPMYDRKDIEVQLHAQFGDLELQAPELRTGLAICTKRIDTGSPWVLFNHPGSKYWESDANKHYKLRDLVRASAAAPYFFDPHEFAISGEGGRVVERGIFVDGGVAGLNNPSVELLTVALQRDYPFWWESGADRLFMISVGTGWRRQRQKADEFLRHKNVWKAKIAMAGMIQDTQLLAIKTMQALAVPPGRDRALNWSINDEVQRMESGPITPAPLLTFRRLDASLELTHVEPVIQNDFKHAKQFDRAFADLSEIDQAKAENLERLYRIGFASASGIEREDPTQTLDVVKG